MTDTPEGMAPIRLVVGLGNPEPRYQRTRHNAGQRVVEALAERLGLPFRAKYRGRFAEGRGPAGPIALLIPTTYMNLSGESIAPAAGSLQIDPSQVLVVHDELDLPFGVVRGKVGGGHGGHNGLRSIIPALGGAPFPRVRLGIGRPDPAWRGDVADWVLTAFAEPPDEVERLIGGGLALVESALADGIDAAIAAAHAREPGARRRAQREAEPTTGSEPRTGSEPATGAEPPASEE